MRSAHCFAELVDLGFDAGSQRRDCLAIERTIGFQSRAADERGHFEPGCVGTSAQRVDLISGEPHGDGYIAATDLDRLGTGSLEF